MLAVFGKVPFFFYVVHIYLIHALAMATGFAMTGVAASAPGLGLGLPAVYVVWLLVLVLLYPLCRWFADLKERRTEWWWSYL
jgi:membrane-bound acyltransferase YfiQ involved in biofilm formation